MNRITWIRSGGGWLFLGGSGNDGILAEGAEAGKIVGAGWVLEEAEGGGFVEALEGGSVRRVTVFDFVVFAGGVDDAYFAGVDFLIVEIGVGDDFGGEEGIFHHERHRGHGGGRGVFEIWILVLVGGWVRRFWGGVVVSDGVARN